MPNIVFYPNLRAEMARQGITAQDLAECLNVTRQYIYIKLNGGKDFSLHDITAIQDLLNKGDNTGGLSLDYLFSKNGA